MRALILITATFLLSFKSFSQGDVFDDYDGELNIYGNVDAYDKVEFVSRIDGKITYFFWGDYTDKGMGIIIEAANEILEYYNMTERVSKDMFLKNGEYFFTGVGDLIFDYNLPDGGEMHVGYEDIDVKIDGINIKAFDLWVKYPNK